MNVECTPGTWILDRDDVEGRYMILAPTADGLGKRLIAYMLFGFLEPAESEQHANARLLVSAKLLAEALQRAAIILRADTRNKLALDALATVEAALAAAGCPLEP